MVESASLKSVHLENADEVMNYCKRVADEIRGVMFNGRRVEVEIDNRDLRGGEKVWSWIKKGIPVRLEIGPRDMASDSVFVGRRDRSPKEKFGQARGEFIAGLADTLNDMQNTLYERAKSYRDEHTHTVNTKDELIEYFNADSDNLKSANGGFAFAPYAASPEDEDALKKELGVTVRCIPIEQEEVNSPCVLTGKSAGKMALFAKAY